VPTPKPLASRATRFPRLDALRGVAVLWMAIFHFDFDLNLLGFIQPRQRFFTDAFWVNQRTCILSLFLFTAGMALAIAVSRGQTWPAFFKRWLQVLLAAALVSLGSWWMQPDRWIWFGVLHAMVVMLLVGRVLLLMGARWWPPSTHRASSIAPWLLWALAAFVLWLPFEARFAGLNVFWGQWTGLAVTRPLTQDWVPFFPWFSAMLAGMAVGSWMVSGATLGPRAWRTRLQTWLATPVSNGWQPMVTLGQWALLFYVLHQPIFFGALSLWKQFTRS
jgi:uncharacterized membrane protein